MSYGARNQHITPRIRQVEHGVIIWRFGSVTETPSVLSRIAFPLTSEREYRNPKYFSLDPQVQVSTCSIRVLFDIYLIILVLFIAEAILCFDVVA